MLSQLEREREHWLWSQEARREGAGTQEGAQGGVEGGRSGPTHPGARCHGPRDFHASVEQKGFLVSHLLGPQASQSKPFCASVSPPIKAIAGTLPLTIYKCFWHTYYDPGTVQGIGDGGKQKLTCSALIGHSRHAPHPMEHSDQWGTLTLTQYTHDQMANVNCEKYWKRRFTVA